VLKLLLDIILKPHKIYRIYVVNEKKQVLEAKLYKDFQKDFEEFNKNVKEQEKAKKENLYPCLLDKTTDTELEPTYFYQDAWAFERIVKDKPTSHLDIGSHHKFVAHLSKVVDLTMVDIRPLSLPMKTIKFIKGSILELPFKDDSIESLSSLCVVEHIGLGRYGDPIDPDGSEKSFKEIERVIKKGGHFYMSVPVEKENKIYFNAHRAFNEQYLLGKILKNFEVIDKKYIYGNNFTDKLEDQFGTGCYHLRKK
jgi:SAM-dependent methyltransferase